jgi:hypothetical protein
MDQRKPSGKSAGTAARPAAKPAAKPVGKSAPAPKSPGDGLLGWLGRQVGHVSKAVKADVTKPAAKTPTSKSSPQSATKPAAGKASAVRPSPPRKQPAADAKRPAVVTAPAEDTKETVIYRHDKVEMAELPDRPGVILRRTIIDEVVVETETATDPKPGA